ncbi:hypothetical protein TrRE_jg13439 [Triparma retinervis]|uniref:Uncharacterized protein n=1 Tax=Triparma retinervis TaxID=2557542 RepID=A0A9W7FGM1_9STRA|nr:hypothetical protein TrRE_jg13439 [Triparma retinervis]
MSGDNSDTDGEGEFYLRYYQGTQSNFIEFELTPSYTLRYANSSPPSLIRRSCTLSDTTVSEFKRIVRESGVLELDDSRWPRPHPGTTRAELEIKHRQVHISFDSEFITSGGMIGKTMDPEGLGIFFDGCTEVKGFAGSLIRGHFNKRPI